jgi:hypothetical protein
MAHTIQITVDAHDPHTLADWWAETLGWEVEPQDEAFIRSMVEQGHATEDETIRHNGALVWKSGAAIRPTEDAAGQPRFLFQWVPDDKTAKNRMHVDIRPEAGTDISALRESLIARGATVLWEGRQGPHTWVTMGDPEGNEFCI